MLELMLYDFARSDGSDNRGNPLHLWSVPSLRAKSYSTSSSIYFVFFLFVPCMVGVIAAHEVIQHQLQHYFLNIVFLFF